MRLREWFDRGDKALERKLSAQLDAANRSLAIIEFDPDGVILDANANFLAAMGYDLADVVGRHHRIFVDPAEASEPGYERFWQDLRDGRFASAQYRRIAKGGREVWLQATYNPLFDAEGAVTGVVKFATDVTEQKRAAAEAAGKLAAVSRAQAMIEFTLDGQILDANENFLNVVGYGLDEIRGQRHRMFVDKAYAESAEYQEFWASLARGEFHADAFKRYGKGGREVWIQASYNPIFDANGKPAKVVKFATDITEQKVAAVEVADKLADSDSKLAAISRAQAVIEFTLDGKIVDANENFLNALGYDLKEVQGQHHRMFVDRAYAESAEYREFWAAMARGEFHADAFKRYGKGGREVWIQASYNPIFDAHGNPVKVVKFATDVTAQRAAVSRLDAALQQLAAGELDVSIDTAFPGDMETLRGAFNQSVERLRGLVSEIRTATAEVAAAARQITSGTADLAARTEQAAANLEETSASTNELSTVVKQNAENARNADAQAAQAQQNAKTGGEVVRKAVAAMSAIEESSGKINEIIGAIKEIAFQTNLLALNASVEAARAGEAGKGFAVVAQEVRQLAQRSAEAAVDTKALIQSSASHVDNGVQLVNQAGEALNGIVEAIGAVAEIVREISTASSEQASGIQEIDSAVTNLDEMTQQNAALVEESTAAAKALSDQASRLDELMSYFKVGDAVCRPAQNKDWGRSAA